MEVSNNPTNNNEFPVAHGSILDSKTSHLDDVLNEKLEDAFHQHPSDFVLHDVAKIASQHDPIDMAHAVSRLPPYARVAVYENLPDFNAKIIFMINTSSSTRSAIFRQIDDNEIKRLIEKMPPDEAVWILDDMSDRRMKRVFDLLDPKKAQRIKELQKHDRHSAGRLMTDEFFAFHMNTTIGEVAAQIRDNPGIELTRRVFVLNDEGQLIGYVPGRNLIVNPSYLPLRQVMRPILHKVTTETSRDEVVDVVERYKIPALPVVDENDRLVGVITYESVVEAMEDIADETIASFAGTAEDYGEYEPILKRFLGRAPWLIVTLCAGLFSTAVMTYFYDRVWFLFLPFFVPLITGMSGNVGIQCSTILVRGMSTGDISRRSKREVISREIGIGLLIGLVFGILCGFVVYLLNHYGVHPLNADPLALATIVSCGVFGIVALAASSPILIIASLAADIGLQTFEFFRAIYNKDVTKALCSLGVIVIDALTLGAIAAGSWQLMVAAAATSAAFMGALAIKAIHMANTKDPLDVLDAICYVALTAVGIASVAITTKFVYHVAKNTHFEIKNIYNYEMRLYDDNNSLVAILKPGESKVLDIDPRTLMNGRDLTVKYFGPNGIITLDSYQVWSPETNTYQTINVTSDYYRGHLQRATVVKPPLSPDKFPTLPVGGPSIVTKDLR